MSVALNSHQLPFFLRMSLFFVQWKWWTIWCRSLLLEILPSRSFSLSIHVSFTTFLIPSQIFQNHYLTYFRQHDWLIITSFKSFSGLHKLNFFCWWPFLTLCLCLSLCLSLSLSLSLSISLSLFLSINISLSSISLSLFVYSSLLYIWQKNQPYILFSYFSKKWWTIWSSPPGLQHWIFLFLWLSPSLC